MSWMALFYLGNRPGLYARGCYLHLSVGRGGSLVAQSVMLGQHFVDALGPERFLKGTVMMMAPRVRTPELPAWCAYLETGAVSTKQLVALVARLAPLAL